MMGNIISLSAARESGATLPSQFQFGEHVHACLDDYLGEGNAWVSGWIVGIHYTVSQVRYDIAVQIGNSDNCLVIPRLRCYMRSFDNCEKKTNFIDVSELNLNDDRLERK